MDDGRPVRNLGLDVHGKFLRLVANRLRAVGRKQLFHIGLMFR